MEEMRNVPKNYNVEGFNPENHLIDLVSKSDPNKIEKYLPVMWRKTWFRLVFPNGKIDTRFEYNPQLQAIITTATVYKDSDDDSKNFLAKDGGIKFIRRGEFINETCVQEAITIAVGRALGSAGFGSQFCGLDDGDTTIPVEAGVPWIEQDIFQDASEEGHIFGNTDSAPTNQVENMPKENKEPVKSKPVNNPKVTKPIANSSVNNSVIKTVEDAKKYKISSGKHANKFLGELFATEPKTVEWYAQKYSGKDENLKVAAKLIVEKAS